MRIHDEGLVIGLKRFGESKWIVSLLTRHHGLVRGLVHSLRKSPLDIGYTCLMRWSARSLQQLGTLSYEVISSTSASLLSYYPRLLTLQSMCDLLTGCLEEHQPYPALFDTAQEVQQCLSDMSHPWAASYIQFELTLLQELGFGLSLENCTVTGRTDTLTYISPKTGCAVSQEAGAAYAGMLFPYIPMTYPELNDHDICVSLIILSFFLEKHTSPAPDPHAFQDYQNKLNHIRSPHARAPSFRLNTVDSRKILPLSRTLLCDLMCRNFSGTLPEKCAA